MDAEIATINPLLRAKSLGQSIWLDYIQRGMIEDGELARLIAEDGLGGITSNPVIFEKAISHSKDYEAAIAAMRGKTSDVAELYDTLVLKDIGDAADMFRPMFEESHGAHGFVSHEVSPHLALDTDGTLSEARRLWQALDRPNVFIKVPGTKPGIPAIETLTSEGINVNVTLLFGVNRYEAVAEAYMAGLEKRLEQGLPVSGVFSVASFFLSRIDHMVDAELKEKGGEALSFRGKTAIALARLAYQSYIEIMESDRWHRLAEAGATPQRLLWASTQPKDPEYPDTKYVDALIGPETVSTLPMETLEAYREHGDPAPRLEDDIEAARALPGELAKLGIDVDQVADKLEEEGIDKFIKPFDALQKALAAKLG
ncbi:transaldolase [Methyloligella sp. 2.7D]|uniref:transaldolase n=1 Tax=unclassified Methyloligella TaxID=2625955 RepID=UPI00157DC4E4|nr:transaldolase [Methyloligella sp. GL2]QKP78103.1 transaldolase [Methyloligella sp. GL2]